MAMEVQNKLPVRNPAAMCFPGAIYAWVPGGRVFMSALSFTCMKCI